MMAQWMLLLLLHMGSLSFSEETSDDPDLKGSSFNDEVRFLTGTKGYGYIADDYYKIVMKNFDGSEEGLYGYNMPDGNTHATSHVSDHKGYKLEENDVLQRFRNRREDLKQGSENQAKVRMQYTPYDYAENNTSPSEAYAPYELPLETDEVSLDVNEAPVDLDELPVEVDEGPIGQHEYEVPVGLDELPVELETEEFPEGLYELPVEVDDVPVGQHENEVPTGLDELPVETEVDESHFELDELPVELETDQFSVGLDEIPVGLDELPVDMATNESYFGLDNLPVELDEVSVGQDEPEAPVGLDELPVETEQDEFPDELEERPVDVDITGDELIGNETSEAFPNSTLPSIRRRRATFIWNYQANYANHACRHQRGKGNVAYCTRKNFYGYSKWRKHRHDLCRSADMCNRLMCVSRTWIFFNKFKWLTPRTGTACGSGRICKRGRCTSRRRPRPRPRPTWKPLPSYRVSHANAACRKSGGSGYEAYCTSRNFYRYRRIYSYCKSTAMCYRLMCIRKIRSSIQYRWVVPSTGSSCGSGTVCRSRRCVRKPPTWKPLHNNQETFANAVCRKIRGSGFEAYCTRKNFYKYGRKYNYCKSNNMCYRVMCVRRRRNRTTFLWTTPSAGTSCGSGKVCNVRRRCDKKPTPPPTWKPLHKDQETLANVICRKTRGSGYEAYCTQKNFHKYGRKYNYCKSNNMCDRVMCVRRRGSRTNFVWTTPSAGTSCGSGKVCNAGRKCDAKTTPPSDSKEKLGKKPDQAVALPDVTAISLVKGVSQSRIQATAVADKKAYASPVASSYTGKGGMSLSAPSGAAIVGPGGIAIADTFSLGDASMSDAEIKKLREETEKKREQMKTNPNPQPLYYKDFIGYKERF